MQQPIHKTHKTFVSPSDLSYMAVCSCGWQSELTSHRYMADRLARKHHEMISVGESR